MAKFGMRNDYRIVDYLGGYVPVCPCAFGAHYLAPSRSGAVEEYTLLPGREFPDYFYTTYADAQAAIETWQRQHQPESEE